MLAPRRSRFHCDMSDRPVLNRVIVVVLLGLLVLLQFRLWVSQDGFAEVRRLHSNVTFQESENASLADRNRRLEAEVHDLKSGFAALEERARSDLGLILPEETFYVIGGEVAGPDDDTTKR